VNETLALFDLRSCTLFESLHVVFGHALSLPGEAQKIDRAMSAFGAAYRRSCSEELRKNNSEDAFYILAFAMVMLNSDLHNPAVKSRMSLAQFRRNLEGETRKKKERED
jgi:brefeldin A-resistance guanine nucleotide exchange factor 1